MTEILQSDYIKTMCDACHIAQPIINSYFKSHISVMYKDKHEVFTKADTESERAIHDAIKNKFPDSGFVMEESGEIDAQKDMIWMIDPIDGTNNFIRKNDHFCISIALAINKKIVSGVIHLPQYNKTFIAERGMGAFCVSGETIEQITASKVSHFNDIRLAAELLKIKNPVNRKIISAFKGHVHGIQTQGSTALDFCGIASGRLDGLILSRSNIWDIAAGIVILEEAGGSVSGVSGNSDYIDKITKDGLIASNGKVHDILLSAMS